MMHPPTPLFVALLILLHLAGSGALAGEDTNLYGDGESVHVYGSKMGPLHDVFETYDVIQAPGCAPKKRGQKEPTLGQALIGEELYELNVTIHFGVDVEEGVICNFTPTNADVARWREMITSRYRYQLFVDDLPIWAMFGSVSGSNITIYLHRIFHLGMNNHQLVNVTLETANAEPVEVGKTYSFTYAARFSPSAVTFENRFAKYVDEELFEPNIRWFAIGNSLFLILLLALLVLAILSNVVRRDYQNIMYNLRMQDEGMDELIENTGWKLLYADVHRVPSNPTLLCALVGTGVQLIVVFTLGILVASLYSLQQKPAHDVIIVVFVLYAITGAIAGFISAWQFLEYATLSPAIAKKWMRCMELTMLAFPLFLASCGTVTNILSHMFDSTRAVHVGGVVFLIGLLILGFCPSVVAGTLVGRYVYRRRILAQRRQRVLPHVNQIPRLIPAPPNVLLSKFVIIPACGILPFGSIVFELFLVMSSIWLNKLYYLYTFLLLTLIIYLVMTCCISVSAVYVLLNIEDHRWQWTSFGCGASSGLYVYLYAAYFYTFRTSMSGIFSFVLYFVYSATLSTAISLTGGSASFFVASLFVRKIYAFVKSD